MHSQLTHGRNVAYFVPEICKGRKTAKRVPHALFGHGMTQVIENSTTFVDFIKKFTAQNIMVAQFRVKQDVIFPKLSNNLLV